MLFRSLSPTLNANLARFAEPLEGPTSQALRSLAMRHGVHLVGPLIEREGAQHFNALLGFTPSGERWLHYRKRNPWYPETWATPGALPFPRATIHGLRVTAAICFDVHFLEETAAEVLAETDLLLFPSAWVSDEDTLPALLRHLARRFDLQVLNANWGPGSPSVLGQGGSLVVGRGGEVLARHADALQPRMDVLLTRP